MNHITRKAQIVVATESSSRQNKFLLLQTNPDRGSYWQNCTGKIEDDEDFVTGALREVMEETGLTKENIKEVIDLELEYQFHDRWKRDVIERSYLVVVKDLWPVAIDPSEHQNFKWVTHSELQPDCVKYEGNFEALQKASQRLKG
ncbi:MAG TPA: NUDIX hydrolase [Bacteriovoracaceae bacterium]|nr:NUDIX hydrolase [Bacteriovoracaceae bacterium]